MLIFVKENTTSNEVPTLLIKSPKKVHVTIVNHCKPYTIE